MKCQNLFSEKNIINFSLAEIAQGMLSIKEKYSVIILEQFQFPKTNIVLLTHLSLASHKWDTGKQCRPRSDAAECSV